MNKLNHIAFFCERSFLDIDKIKNLIEYFNSIKTKQISFAIHKNEFYKYKDKLISNDYKIRYIDENFCLKDEEDVLVNFFKINDSFDFFLKIIQKSLSFHEENTEKNIEKSFLTSGFLPIDLMIFEDKNIRITQEFLWLAAYSEIGIINQKFSKFNLDLICDIISNYKNVDRRYGKA